MGRHEQDGRALRMPVFLALGLSILLLGSAGSGIVHWFRQAEDRQQWAAMRALGEKAFLYERHIEALQHRQQDIFRSFKAAESLKQKQSVTRLLAEVTRDQKIFMTKAVFDASLQTQQAESLRALHQNLTAFEALSLSYSAEMEALFSRTSGTSVTAEARFKETAQALLSDIRLFQKDTLVFAYFDLAMVQNSVLQAPDHWQDSQGEVTKVTATLHLAIEDADLYPSEIAQLNQKLTEQKQAFTIFLKAVAAKKAQEQKMVLSLARAALAAQTLQAQAFHTGLLETQPPTVGGLFFLDGAMEQKAVEAQDSDFSTGFNFKAPSLGPILFVIFGLALFLCLDIGRLVFVLGRQRNGPPEVQAPETQTGEGGGQKETPADSERPIKEAAGMASQTPSGDVSQEGAEKTQPLSDPQAPASLEPMSEAPPLVSAAEVAARFQPKKED